MSDHDSKTELDPATLLAHGGGRRNYEGEVNPPIFMSSLFAQPSFDDFAAHTAPYSYTRGRNPTVEALERVIAKLEGAHGAKIFASGMAAISAAILSCVSAGDHIVAVDSIYGPAREFIADYLSRFGIRSTFVSGERVEDFMDAVESETRLIYLESPSTFVFRLQNLREVANFARSRGIHTIVDNSWATPIYQRPLALGIDIVVHSATKYIGGHSDVVAGVVAADAKHLTPIARKEFPLLGGIAAPFEAWLLMRGIRTLDVRLARHQESGLTVARWLEQHPYVRRVHHPGLPSHTQYDLAREQMTGYSGLFSFELEGGVSDVRQMIDRLRLFHLGYSWGGFESLVYAPVIASLSRQRRGDPDESVLPQTLVRVSVGLESPNDLIADLDQALNRA